MLGPNLSFPGVGQESSICVHSLNRPALDPLDREVLVTQEVKHTEWSWSPTNVTTVNIPYLKQAI